MNVNGMELLRGLGKLIGLGKVIDTTDALLKGSESVGPGKVKTKVYPRLKNSLEKGPMGIEDLGQETSSEREKYTKG